MNFSKRLFLRSLFAATTLSVAPLSMAQSDVLALTDDEKRMINFMKASDVENFLMLNKSRGQILFVENGVVTSAESALTGKYRGDTHRSDLGTTPAGIHLLRSYNNNTDIGFKEIPGTNLDYLIHRVATPPGQRRPERLKSLNPDWKRISSGCVNVTQETLNKILKFMKTPAILNNKDRDYSLQGSFFVVLPEVMPLESILKYPEISRP